MRFLLSPWERKAHCLTAGFCWLDRPALQVVRPLLLALSYLHGKGIIHRDLKPESVVVMRDGCTKLTNLGLSLDTSQEVPTSRVGTLPVRRADVTSTNPAAPGSGSFTMPRGDPAAEAPRNRHSSSFSASVLLAAIPVPPRAAVYGPRARPHPAQEGVAGSVPASEPAARLLPAQTICKGGAPGTPEATCQGAPLRRAQWTTAPSCL